jgi:hypothetical protein
MPPGVEHREGPHFSEIMWIKRFFTSVSEAVTRLTPRQLGKN